MDNKTDNRPVLIFDGACDICLEWVGYWRQLLAEKIDFRPYQDTAVDYPDISIDEFKRAIQLVEPSGVIINGAEATFSLYRNIHPYSLLILLYKYLPGFAVISELFYSFFSHHRRLLSFITHLFWGREFTPTRYDLISTLFLRLLGLIYLAAFVSLGVQVVGLIGSEGIIPFENYLNYVKQQLGTDSYYRIPTIFWLYLNDSFLELICFLGGIFSILVIVNCLQVISLILLYVLYLSLCYAGQTFMTFQWDMLLLEVGFLAIFIRTGSPVIVWLYRWLVFRFMFLGGVVKIISKDPSWNDLTALNYHFETQPLPNIFAWYIHHFPEWLLMMFVAITFIVELIIPFLIFSPRRFRIMAAWCFILFQLSIIISGNYNFFNLLTVIICLFLFDDAAMIKCIPSATVDRFTKKIHFTRGRIMASLSLLLLATVIYASTEQMNRLFSGDRSSESSVLNKAIAPFRIVNSYGPFAIMTTTRNEIIIEGSMDGISWIEYEFKYKPGDLTRRPLWIIPHQPRLDWQMWFAALSEPRRNPWFENLLIRLLQNSKDVTKLLDFNPFPDKPPLYVRGLFYEYHFTRPEERKKSGDWWVRKLVGKYYPSIHFSLK